MIELTESFWNATVEEIKRGYIHDETSDEYVCLLCGERFERGIIYPHDDKLYEAERFASLHITNQHGSVFQSLLDLNKKLTGLTDLQKNLLACFYQGLSDSDIVKELDSGSTSTIRNHRFTLREKEKQAKIFLTLMELIDESTGKRGKGASTTSDATSVSRRTTNAASIPTDEEGKILHSYFPAGLDGPLSEFPKKEKRKAIVLHHIIKRFLPGKQYTEAEVNDILAGVYHDYVTIRRYLIEYNLLDRHDDCSAYWVKQKEGIKMNSLNKRAEMKLAYKQTPKTMGVYQIKNLANGKLFVGASLNVDAMFNRLKFELKFGSNNNKDLQNDWNEQGEANFTFEVLERIKQNDDPSRNYKEELAQMEAKWLADLQPYGERGYNKQ